MQQTTSGDDNGYADDARHSSAGALTLATTASSRSSLPPTTKEKGTVSSASPALQQASRSSKRSSTRKSTSGTAGPDDAFLNPATDHLAPVVTFTQNYDFLVMNGQCPELADSMEVGPWGQVYHDEGILRSLVSSTALSGSRVSLSSDGWGWMEEPDQKAIHRVSPKEEGKFFLVLNSMHIFLFITNQLQS